jgi:hypothetical protein
MSEMHFYLSAIARANLARGGKGMYQRLRDAVAEVGWRVHIHDEGERPDIPNRDGWHLVNNRPPLGERCLTLRVAGFQPFWQIERSNDRWDWDIAAKSYQPPEVAPARIAEFVAQWRRFLMPDLSPRTGGGIFVPLQGLLTQRRSFQTVSPVLMLHEVLTRFPDRPVTATLHPRETYGPEERAALAALLARHDNFRLHEGGSMPVLADCDMVITENSSVALKGFLMDKPAMFWARIEFHHIAASVPHIGEEAAFRQMESGLRPDFGRYLFWYLRRQSLFGWEDNPARIRWRLRELGWPIRAW